MIITLSQVSLNRRLTNSISRSILTKFHPRLFSVASDEDLAIHNSYYGLQPRLETITSLILNKGIQPFQELVDLGISANIIRAFPLKADLEHPLLKKYEFDVKEFVKGAKISIENVFEAGHSEDFINYVNDSKINSDSDDFRLTKISPNKAITYLKENCSINVLMKFTLDAQRSRTAYLESLLSAHESPFQINRDRKVETFRILGAEVFYECDDLDSIHTAICEWMDVNQPFGSLCLEIQCEITFDQSSGIPSIDSENFVNFTCLFSPDKGLTPWKIVTMYNEECITLTH